MKFKRPDGKNVRPDLAVIDDPQTDESAKSPTQSAERVEIVCGAVLGLAGPGKKIAAVMPCTVIRPGDMADEVLNREKHPEWQGERTKLLYKEPTDGDLWEKYRAIRAEGVRSGDEGKAGTDFYRAHRAAMDAGAEVAWPERRNPDELSALQHCMNLRYDRGEQAWGAEYQNEPVAKTVDAGEGLTADAIAARVNNRGRGEIPDEAAHLVAFIDVQKPLLWWVVAAFAPNFTGWVVDYGAYPDQKREYFAMRDAKHTLQTRYPKVGLEAQLYSGLTDVAALILGREWPRDDGTPAKISRCVVDANWGESTELVKKWCRESPHAAILTPSHGKYVGAASIPFAEYKKKPGDRVGLNWRMPVAARGQKIRHLLYDTNWWKSSLMSRLTVPMGGVGCLSFFGTEAEQHKMIAAHATAERGERTFGRGREVVEFKNLPSRPDNHLLDGLVGCLVAASVEGAAIAETAPPEKPVKRARMKLSEIQKAKRKNG